MTKREVDPILKLPVKGAKKRQPIKPRATRRISEEAEYAALRRELLPLRREVWCAAMMPYDCGYDCTLWATELHHLRKRSAGGALTNPANVIPVCHDCNMAIEDNPIRARQKGLVVREGDPKWEALSSRAWRKR